MRKKAMIITIGLVWASAASAQVVNAPVIVSERSYAVPRAAEGRAMSVMPIAIRISLGRQLLWSGPLNIGGTGQARISITEPVAGANACSRPGEDRLSRQIELSINPQNYRPTDIAEYRLSVRYSRPSDGNDCPSGSRSIAIDQSFSLDGRKNVVFEGDGGLQVQISVP